MSEHHDHGLTLHHDGILDVAHDHVSGIAPHAHHHVGHVWADAVAEPGDHLSLHDRLGLPDPLVDMREFVFPAFTLPHAKNVLVDTDGDGIPDHTAWGTPVGLVGPYVRTDGTVVSGHFRTFPDGVRWNNLG